MNLSIIGIILLLNRMKSMKSYTFWKLSSAAIHYDDEQLLKYFIKCSFCELCTGVAVSIYQSSTKYALLDDKYEDKLINISVVFQKIPTGLRKKVVRATNVLNSNVKFTLGFIQLSDISPQLTEIDYRNGWAYFHSFYHGNDLLYFLTKLVPSLKLIVSIQVMVMRSYELMNYYASARIISLQSNRESYRIQFNGTTSTTTFPLGNSLIECHMDEHRIPANGQPFTVSEGVGFWGNCFTVLGKVPMDFKVLNLRFDLTV
ncbi:hypothetical protein SNEBB_005407 [Seison nebaliae]|nr:hypothetical protein SNEBB_005407 [Seison nebaliae]